MVRPEREKILTALRRGECNALMVPDIDRAMRDPRTLEDLIDAIELYDLYVASLTGNIDLTTDAGISAARGLVNQRNQESRNTSRHVANGQWHAALKGGNHGGKNRPYGWRKDRIHLSKREAGHIRQEIQRILAGVRPITLAREWSERGIPTVTGSPWQAATIKNIFTGPRIAGYVVYQGEILYGPNGNRVRGQWGANPDRGRIRSRDSEMEAGPAGSISPRGDRERPRYRVPTIPIRAVREMQFADARRTPQR